MLNLVWVSSSLISVYTQVEKIAKERGDMSSHLHRVLQEREATISELFDKLKEYDACMDDAEIAFKAKLQKKAQVCASLKHFLEAEHCAVRTTKLNLSLV